jgi:hypothetical protein
MDEVIALLRELHDELVLRELEELAEQVRAILLVCEEML